MLPRPGPAGLGRSIDLEGGEGPPGLNEDEEGGPHLDEEGYAAAYAAAMNGGHGGAGERPHAQASAWRSAWPSGHPPPPVQTVHSCWASLEACPPAPLLWLPLTAGPSYQASNPYSGAGGSGGMQGDEIELPEGIDTEEARMLEAAMLGIPYQGRIPDFSNR